jgi:putative addiction module component (TIGR02574 family)
MTRPASRLLEEALRLSDADRAELAARLIDSLDPDADAEAAWGEEVQRRLDDLEQGRVRSVPWTEARRQILDDGDGPSRTQPRRPAR